MGKMMCEVNYRCKLRALVYDFLPSTTAVFSYAIGSRKMSAKTRSGLPGRMFLREPSWKYSAKLVGS